MFFFTSDIANMNKVPDVLVWFIIIFNCISTFLGYLMPKPSYTKNSTGTI